jgi:hypothetical protein
MKAACVWILLLGVAVSAIAADPDPNKPSRVVLQVRSIGSSAAAGHAKVNVAAGRHHAEAPEGPLGHSAAPLLFINDQLHTLLNELSDARELPAAMVWTLQWP